MIRLRLLILLLTIISLSAVAGAFVAKPIDKIPGVVMPTSNPDIPTPTPLPKATQSSQQATPIYNLNVQPSVQPSPIFVPMADTSENVTKEKQKSSYLKTVLFIAGGLVFVGIIVFIYRSQGKG